MILLNNIYFNNKFEAEKKHINYIIVFINIYNFNNSQFLV